MGTLHRPNTGADNFNFLFLRKGDGKDICEWPQLQQQLLAGVHLTVVLIRHMLLVMSHRSSCSASASFILWCHLAQLDPCLGYLIASLPALCKLHL